MHSPSLDFLYDMLSRSHCLLSSAVCSGFLSVSCTSEHLVVGSPFTNHASMNSYGTPRSPLPILLKSEVAMSKAFDDLIYKLTKSCCYARLFTIQKICLGGTETDTVSCIFDTCCIRVFIIVSSRLLTEPILMQLHDNLCALFLTLAPA